MHWLYIFGIAVGLAMDALAVSIAAGLAIDRLTRRHIFRLAFHFGLFQFMMPILGWLAGCTVASYIVDYDHWVALGLLGIIGGKMLLDACLGKEKKFRSCPTRGWKLVTLSVATSIDALAVGVSMAFLMISIWLPCVIIGLVAGIFSWVGVTFGHRIGRRWGRWAEVVGGIILICIGLRILITHLTTVQSVEVVAFSDEDIAVLQTMADQV
ncbi:MAG: manganese efflux pump, partial [Planctomycetota bacterium]